MGASSGIELAARVVLQPAAASGEAYIGECAAQYSIPNMTSWCPLSLLDVGQLTAYYKQQALQAAWDQGFDLPNAIYIDAVGHGGQLRTGTRRLSSNVSLGDAGGPICSIFTWTACLSDEDVAAAANGGCPSEWSPNGDSSPWATYNSDGTTEVACTMGASAAHRRCCRDADSDHASDSFGYTDLIVAVNTRRGCAALAQDDPDAAACAAVASEAAGRFLHPTSKTWGDPATGRLVGWPSMV